MSPRSIPFLLIHLLPFGAVFTGARWFDVGLCLVFYAVRMFFVTAGYHRYFAHRSYRLGRIAQFIMAVGGTLALQKGPLWWAAHHRNHHRYSDTARDIHSPLRGFWWSHIGWILSRESKIVSHKGIQDLVKFPELRWLDRHYLISSIILGAAVYLLWGPSALLVGYILSVILSSHSTFFINSLAHIVGWRRYATADASRNNFFLALLTFGEGWHNNHHHYRASAKQGFFWWEIDMSYYFLKILAWVRIIRDLRRPPAMVLAKNRIMNRLPDVGLLQFKLDRARSALNRMRARAGRAYERKCLAVQRLEEQIVGMNSLITVGNQRRR